MGANGCLYEVVGPAEKSPGSARGVAEKHSSHCLTLAHRLTAHANTWRTFTLWMGMGLSLTTLGQE